MPRWRRAWSGTDLGLPSRHAVHEVLSFANHIAAPLREGFASSEFGSVVEPLRTMLTAGAIALTDTQHVIGWDADAAVHDVADVQRALVMGHVAAVLGGHAGEVVPVGGGFDAVVEPLVVDHHVAGAIAVYAANADLALVRATQEVARWISTQIQLGELDRSRAIAAGAQLRALRAQISPHFLFNALNTIASFVRTDPERARDLLVEFADFARYSFSTTGQFTSLADELRAIDTFVALERARFGDRLNVRIRVAPEVLGVRIPFLVLQPVVENALQHGLYRKQSPGVLRIDAVDVGAEAVISVEDDGVGMAPDKLADILSGRIESAGIGLRNVDERMRTVFGPAYGLAIDTNIGAGTKVTIRVPKTLP
jgi:two-component system, LytTR family, sensor kinase